MRTLTRCPGALVALGELESWPRMTGDENSAAVTQLFRVALDLESWWPRMTPAVRQKAGRAWDGEGMTTNVPGTSQVPGT